MHEAPVFSGGKHMIWEKYVIALLVIWAVAHSYMDYRLMKRGRRVGEENHQVIAVIA